MDQTATASAVATARAEDNPNQSPPLEDYDLYTADHALQEAVRRADAGWAEGWLAQFGARLGRAETLALGAAATATRRCCTRTIASATGATKSSSIPRTTN